MIPFDLRCKLIQASINEFAQENLKKGKKQIKIFIYEWEGRQQYFVDFPQVIKEIKTHLYENGFNDIKLLYVCGMDHYIKYKQYLYKNVVVIDRKQYKNPCYKTNINNMTFFSKMKEVNQQVQLQSKNYIKKEIMILLKKLLLKQLQKILLNFMIDIMKTIKMDKFTFLSFYFFNSLAYDFLKFNFFLFNISFFSTTNTFIKNIL